MYEYNISKSMITKSFTKKKRFNRYFKFIYTLNQSNFMRKSVP